MAGQALFDPLKCGECGGETFKLVNVRHPDQVRAGGGGSVPAPAATSEEKVGFGRVDGYIRVECAGCHKFSRVAASTCLAFDYEGSLCGGWGE